MYKIILLTFLISNALASDFYSFSCPSARSQNLIKLLKSISAGLEHLNTETDKVCSYSPNVVPVEIFGDDCFKLEYYLPDYLGNFKILIKHRLIYVLGHDPMTQVCDRTYGDIRFLPDFVNTHRAVWNFENHRLTVSIPYKYPIHQEMSKYCNREIDETLITVSKSLYDNPTDYDMY